MTDDATAPEPADSEPRWRPIGPIDRRVVGVLAEKAKTTPDTYPLSLNAVRTGCNQKSNRFPTMSLEPEDVEEALERLRLLGAVGIVEGYGRVSKYRHYLYEWLAVDKVEVAVMAELLLRGAQTEGELRGRAGRMEPIADLSALRPVVASLKSKGLVIGLTPEGRGHVVSHTLYEPKELEKLKAQYAGIGTPETTAARSTAPVAAPPAPAAPAGAIEVEVIATIHRDLGELRSQVSQLRSDMDELMGKQRRLDDDVRDLRDTLGG